MVAKTAPEKKKHPSATSKTSAEKKSTATKKSAPVKATVSKASTAKKSTPTKTAPVKATASKASTVKKSAPAKTAPVKATVSKASTVKKSTPAKTTARKTTATKKSAPTKTAPVAKLTEADIRAWNGSDNDYMNEAHLAYFRDVLLQMQEEIINKANNTADYLQDQEATPDPADRATLEEEYSLELRTRDRERKLLNKVQSSLRQIDEGTYGYCLDTGEIIGLKRLLIRPTATLSVEAQERREQMKKQFAD